jgi:ketosteroid isomerase-like protein
VCIESPPAVTREEMDRIIDHHFALEATDDIEGVMGTLAEDAEHEVVPSPVGALTDRAKIRAYYEMLFKALKGESVTPVRRLYGEEFVVDETIWHGHVNDGTPFLGKGRSGPVSFRALHVFNFRDGKIAREQVWCDLASIQQQLSDAQSASEGEGGR